jgi:hypothetical protein
MAAALAILTGYDSDFQVRPSVVVARLRNRSGRWTLLHDLIRI